MQSLTRDQAKTFITQWGAIHLGIIKPIQSRGDNSCILINPILILILTNLIQCYFNQTIQYYKRSNLLRVGRLIDHVIFDSI